ncbi:MAG: ABC transporter substrate-binding protein [Chloroflexi bacterium]|nr:ABC transporter substrate-binding protein [Chloroflexota bacterium]
MIRKFVKYLFSMTMALCIAATVSAQDIVELSFAWTEDGVDSAVMRDLLDRFQAANPDIAISLDVQAASAIQEAIESGQAPDMARLTDVAAFRGAYLDLRALLDDPAMLEENFHPAILDALRGGSDDAGLYGFADQLSLTAPYINISAFEVAGVALPSDVMEEPSLDDWLAALEEVAGATGIPYLLSIDNRDHRLLGPAMRMGAVFLDADGNLNLPDDSGLRSFLGLLKGLMDEGKVPGDVLLGTGRSESYFVRGDALMYICASGKAESVAEQIGESFDWIIAPNPHGAAGNTGFASLSAVVAFAGTQHPQAVARVMEYLLQPALYAEYSARTLTIPAHLAVIEAAVAYAGDDDTVKAALQAFAHGLPDLQDQAILFDLHPLASAYYEASNASLQPYFAGDLMLDEALAALHARLDEAADMSG